MGSCLHNISVHAWLTACYRRRQQCLWPAFICCGAEQFQGQILLPASQVLAELSRSAAGTVPMKRCCLAWRQGVQCNLLENMGCSTHLPCSTWGDKSRSAQVALAYMHEPGPGVSLQLQDAPCRKTFPKFSCKGHQQRHLGAAQSMVDASPGPPAEARNVLCSGTCWAACRVSSMLLAFYLPASSLTPAAGPTNSKNCTSALSHFRHLQQGQAALPHSTPLLQGRAAPAVSPAQLPVRSALTPSGKGWMSPSQPHPCSCGWQTGRAWWHASTTPKL